jgi:hypothetical protein
LQIGPRFSPEAGGNHGLNSFNLRILDRNRNATSADYIEHARGHENRQTVEGVKLAEHIPRKQRSIHFPRPATPALLGLKCRKKGLISLAGK